MALSKLWFSSFLTPIPRECNKEIQHIIDWFLNSHDTGSYRPDYETKRAMSIERTQLPSKLGGLQMPAFPARFVAIKARFLLKLLAFGPDWVWDLLVDHLTKWTERRALRTKNPPLMNLLLSPPHGDAAISSTSPIIGGIRSASIYMAACPDSSDLKTAFKEFLTNPSTFPRSRLANTTIPSTKEIYSTITSTEPILTKRQRELQKEYNVKFTDIWKNMHQIPCLANQFKVINSFCNSTLRYYPNRKCQRCDNPQESRIHIFFECPASQKAAATVSTAFDHITNSDTSTVHPWTPRNMLKIFSKPKSVPLAATLHAVTIWLLWLQRCKFHHEGTLIPDQELASLTTKSTTNILLAHKERFNSTHQPAAARVAQTLNLTSLSLLSLSS
jgi:hypothetical protein